ncbi:MAG: dihydropteroate synthase [Euryarchaeota archaeon]|nr:dihydropteroate synthase [Euryarchaeota archaeon]
MQSSSDAVIRPPTTWAVRGNQISLGRRTLVMGIVNVTPDSFSDGGRFLDPQAAVSHARALAADGADILDIGGESTRPGSEDVPAGEEARRVVPVVRALAKAVPLPLSVDTRKAAVATAAIEAGAHIVNDVSAFHDAGMARVVADTGAGLVLMHMLGEPKSMQVAPSYKDVVAEVASFLGERADRALAAGVARDAIVVDPGLGFGKRTGKGVEDNATLLKHVAALRRLGYPVLVGASRKSFIGNILGVPLAERLEGSLAAAAVAAWNGADIVRVHDVKATRRVVDLVDAVRNAP